MICPECVESFAVYVVIEADDFDDYRDYGGCLFCGKLWGWNWMKYPHSIREKLEAGTLGLESMEHLVCYRLFSTKSDASMTYIWEIRESVFK